MKNGHEEELTPEKGGGGGNQTESGTENRIQDGERIKAKAILSHTFPPRYCYIRYLP